MHLSQNNNSESLGHADYNSGKEPHLYVGGISLSISGILFRIRIVSLWRLDSS
jgi:hypothetical protein